MIFLLDFGECVFVVVFKIPPMPSSGRTRRLIDSFLALSSRLIAIHGVRSPLLGHTNLAFSRFIVSRRFPWHRVPLGSIRCLRVLVVSFLGFLVRANNFHSLLFEEVSLSFCFRRPYHKCESVDVLALVALTTSVVCLLSFVGAGSWTNSPSGIPIWS